MTPRPLCPNRAVSESDAPPWMAPLSSSCSGAVATAHWHMLGPLRSCYSPAGARQPEAPGPLSLSLRIRPHRRRSPSPQASCVQDAPLAQ